MTSSFVPLSIGSYLDKKYVISYRLDHYVENSKSLLMVPTFQKLSGQLQLTELKGAFHCSRFRVTDVNQGLRDQVVRGN